MGRKEEIQVALDIGQPDSHHKELNNLDYLIQEKWLLNLKRHGRVIKPQAMTS